MQYATNEVLTMKQSKSLILIASNRTLKNSAKRAAARAQKPRMLLPEQERIILAHRESARKMALKLLRRWGAQLESDEVDSIRDLALCEAAKTFSPSNGTKFVTYFFFFLKGFLIREITRRASGVNECPVEESEFERAASDNNMCHKDSFPMPDDALYQSELRNKCEEALQELSPIEQKVVNHVHVLGYKVAAVARKFGYSRGHVSEIRRKAFGKLRTRLNWYPQAA